MSTLFGGTVYAAALGTYIYYSIWVLFVVRVFSHFEGCSPGELLFLVLVF